MSGGQRSADARPQCQRCKVTARHRDRDEVAERLLRCRNVVRDHPSHVDGAWAGVGFDADAFDLAAVSRRLRRVR